MDPKQKEETKLLEEEADFSDTMETPEEPDFENAEPIDRFLWLGLTEDAAKGAVEAGFEAPTEIQRKVIPAVVEGYDVVACSETGSGKTASFALPILDRIRYSSPFVQVLVLVPTRELCRQVAESFRELAGGHKVKVAEIYGGMSYTGQRRALADKPQVVVGAPGRVLDLMGSRDLDFKDVEILVLDEADRMLDMGFMPQISEIIAKVPMERQNLMFSATIPEQVSRFVKLCLSDPVNIVVGTRTRPPDRVIQQALDVMPSEKDARLVEIVAQEPGTILIFTATKVGADKVHRLLVNAGQKACVIHADRAQAERKKSLDGFSCGKYRIMVATDVAQRGLDISGISLVVNYDLPNTVEDYVHRIGRTGRANTPGRALSLVTYKEYALIKNIQKVTGHKFENFGPPGRIMDRRANLKRRKRD